LVKDGYNGPDVPTRRGRRAHRKRVTNAGRSISIREKNKGNCLNIRGRRRRSEKPMGKRRTKKR